MTQLKQIPSLRQICDEFAARQLERDHKAGKAIVHGLHKEGGELVIHMAELRPVSRDSKENVASPMKLRLDCSDMTRERLLKYFNAAIPENPKLDTSCAPRTTIRLKSSKVYEDHGVTGFYASSKTLTEAYFKRSADGTVDRKTIVIRFAPDQEGNVEQRELRYEWEKLARDAMIDLQRTAKANRKTLRENREPISHGNDRPAPRKSSHQELAGLRAFLR